MGLAQVLPCLGQRCWEGTTPMETLQNCSPISQRRISSCGRAQGVLILQLCVSPTAGQQEDGASPPLPTQGSADLTKELCVSRADWVGAAPSLPQQNLCQGIHFWAFSLEIGLILHSFPSKSIALGWQMCTERQLWRCFFHGSSTPVFLQISAMTNGTLSNVF